MNENDDMDGADGQVDPWEEWSWHPTDELPAMPDRKKWVFRSDKWIVGIWIGCFYGDLHWLCFGETDNLGRYYPDEVVNNALHCGAVCEATGDSENFTEGCAFILAGEVAGLRARFEALRDGNCQEFAPYPRHFIGGDGHPFMQFSGKRTGAGVRVSMTANDENWFDETFEFELDAGELESLCQYFRCVNETYPPVRAHWQQFRRWKDQGEGFGLFPQCGIRRSREVVRERGGNLPLALTARIWEKPPLKVFLEEGFAGLRNAAGEEVLSPAWGQIEVLENAVMARRPEHWEWFGKDGHRGAYNMFKDNRFYRNGKAGLTRDGQVWCEAAYDRIDDWSDAGFDVVYTLEGKTPRYWTGDHKPVLTQWRRFPDLPGEEEPYSIRAWEDSPFLVSMERSQDGNDPQTCRFKDGFVRLDRIRKSEILPMFATGSQIRKMPGSRLAEFDGALTYRYSAFIACGKGPEAITDCFRDFEWMDCFKTSRVNWLVLVSVSPERRMPLDARMLVRGDWETAHWDPTDDFAIGFDESLEEDEVRVFLVRYHSDYSLPPEEEGLYRALYSYQPRRIGEAISTLQSFAKSDWYFATSAAWEAFRLEINRPLRPSANVPPGYSWKEIEAGCRFLLAEGMDVQDWAFRICAGRWGHMDDEKIPAIAATLPLLLEWAFAHGSDPNYIHEGWSCLDTLGAIQYARGGDLEAQFIEDFGDEAQELLDSEPYCPERQRLAHRLREIVLASGGKSRIEIQEDLSPVWIEMPHMPGGRKRP